MAFPRLRLFTFRGTPVRLDADLLDFLALKLELEP
jgi:hypothetical protein